MNHKEKKLIKAAQYAAFRRFVQLESSPTYIRRWIGLNAWELRTHIEELMTLGMDWDNYGKFWIIDHLIPLRMFDLLDEAAMKICWHPVNLHPFVWADDPWKHGSIDFSIKMLKDRPSAASKVLLRMAYNELSKQQKYEVNATK